MSEMFTYTDHFKQDLSKWDVRKVTDVSYMFCCSEFNGDLSAWHVGNVATMKSMFMGNRIFDGNISTWDVSNDC